MPRFIGNSAPATSVRLADNFTPKELGHLTLVKVQFQTLRKMLSENDDLKVFHSLNTLDKGGIHLMAKRWWNFFVFANAYNQFREKFPLRVRHK